MDRAGLEEHLDTCPPGAAERMLAIPDLTVRWLPWAEEQLAALCEIAGVPDGCALHLGAEPWYVMLCAHYMLHDAVVDEISPSPAQLISACDAQSLTSLSFEACVAPHLHRERLPLVRRRTLWYMAARNDALLVECERKASRAVPTGVDRDTAIGRNNAPLLALEILRAAVGDPLAQDVLEAVAELLYLMQLGDDVGDWEYDYKTGNHTPFIRWGLQEIEDWSAKTIEHARVVVFTTGYYERYLARLICDFDNLRGCFETWGDLRCTRALAYIDSARTKAVTLMTECVAAKLARVSRSGDA